MCFFNGLNIKPQFAITKFAPLPGTKRGAPPERIPQDAGDGGLKKGGWYGMQEKAKYVEV